MRHTTAAAVALRQPKSTWIWAVAAGIAALYIGSTLPTPLYPLYRREFGFSELIVTAIYASYALGNLAVLFALGRLSDQIGRRPTTLLAFALLFASAVCFVLASDTAWLFIARVLNGLAAGLGAGALTAWIAELEPTRDRARAATIASTGNLAGLAIGALMAGLLAQYGPWPLRTSYVVFLPMLLLVFAMLWTAPESVGHVVRDAAELSLRPRIGVPRAIRAAFIGPAVMAFDTFALGGFYAALAPSLLSQSLHVHNLAAVGALVAVFFGGGAIIAASTGALRNRPALLVATVLLLLGLTLLIAAERLGSVGLLVTATLISGAATAIGYRSSLRIVNEITPPARRAEVVSSYLLVCYTANSLPVIGVGLLSVLTGAPTAHLVFALVLAVLAVIASATGWRYVPRQ